MKARGKHRAKRGASPLVKGKTFKESGIRSPFIPLFQSFTVILFVGPGATRFAALSACPWLSYFRVVFASAPARAARLSPDQKWMAYTSNRNGSVIAVRRVGPSGMPMGAEYVVSDSSRGATTSMWRADGKELFYLDGGTLMAVPIETSGDRFVAGTPKPLCKLNVEDQERRNRYLVGKDGLFLVVLKNTAD